MFSYLLHLLKSKGPDRVHSPFVFDLYFHTLRNKYKHYSFKSIEKKHHKDVSKSHHTIGESIFKIVNKFQPENILFISDYSLKNASYISKARKKTTIDCLISNTVNTENVKNQSNINIVTQVQPQNKTYQLIVLDCKSNFIDFDLYSFTNNPIIILTNIQTNKAQQQCWNSSLQGTKYNIYLDFFYFGLTMHRKEQKTEYFLLRL